MIQHHFCDGVYAKESRVGAGSEIETHEHKYDHLSILGSGAVLLELDGALSHHTGPCVLEIKAGKKHRIQALTDITWFCIHATDVADPENIDAALTKE